MILPDHAVANHSLSCDAPAYLSEKNNRLCACRASWCLSASRKLRRPGAD